MAGKGRTTGIQKLDAAYALETSADNEAYYRISSFPRRWESGRTGMRSRLRADDGDGQGGSVWPKTTRRGQGSSLRALSTGSDPT